MCVCVSREEISMQTDRQRERKSDRERGWTSAKFKSSNSRAAIVNELRDRSKSRSGDFKILFAANPSFLPNRN